jgi:hypothetical protein
MTASGGPPSIGFGPIRHNRIVMTAVYPVLILLIFWAQLRPIGRAALVILSAFGAYRAFRMSVCLHNGRLTVKGFISSPSIPVSAVSSVQFRKTGRQVTHRLHLIPIGNSQETVVAEGVSMRHWASLGMSQKPRRAEERARQKVEAFFEGTPIIYLTPNP